MSDSRKPLVVIVEDEEDSRETLQELLEHFGHEVRTAANGQEALELLGRVGDRRCVVLLDLFMPVLDGWGVYEQLQASGRLDALRVVITTSAPHRAPAGAAVLEKPLDIPKLLQIIDAA